MNNITFTILKMVVSIAAALVTAYLIPYIKSCTKTAEQEEILKIVDVAVRAAEQTMKDGRLKKEDVTAFVTTWLNGRGIKVTDEQLDKLIESAVYSMKNADNIIVNNMVESVAEKSEQV